MEEEVRMRKVSYIGRYTYSKPIRHYLLRDLVEPCGYVYVLLREDQVSRSRYRARIYNELFAVECTRAAVIARDRTQRDRLNVVSRGVAERG
jgi:hypothetical protein